MSRTAASGLTLIAMGLAGLARASTCPGPFADGPAIHVARLDASGGVLGEALPGGGDTEGSYYPSLTWNGSEVGVAWEDYRLVQSDIYFSRLDQAGRPLGAETRVTQDLSESINNAFAAMRSTYGLIWLDGFYKPHGITLTGETCSSSWGAGRTPRSRGRIRLPCAGAAWRLCRSPTVRIRGRASRRSTSPPA